MKKLGQAIVLSLVMCTGMACVFGMNRKLKISHKEESRPENTKEKKTKKKTDISCWEAISIIWNWSEVDFQDEAYEN